MAQYDIVIDVVGTEVFHQNWSGNSDDKLESMRIYARDVWESDINDSNDTYEPFCILHTESDTSIPESALPSNTDYLGDRALDGDEWLKNNTDWYDTSDSIIVADYYGDNYDTHGTAGDETAGSGDNLIAWADAYFEDTGTIMSEYENGGTEAIGAHENGHPYSGDHVDATGEWYNYGTLMWSSTTNPTCNTSYSVNEVYQAYSDCNVSAIRTFIDNNF